MVHISKIGVLRDALSSLTEKMISVRQSSLKNEDIYTLNINSNFILNLN